MRATGLPRRIIPCVTQRLMPPWFRWQTHRIPGGNEQLSSEDPIFVPLPLEMRGRDAGRPVVIEVELLLNRERFSTAFFADMRWGGLSAAQIYSCITQA